MQYPHTAPRLLFEVGRECFQPQPKVTSGTSLRAEVQDAAGRGGVLPEIFFFRVYAVAPAPRDDRRPR